MAQQAQVMQDMGVFCQHLRPEGANRDKHLGTVEVLAAMAECPSFESLTVAIKNAPADQQKATVLAFINLERTLLEHGTEADAASLREIKTKPEKKRRGAVGKRAG